MTKVRVTEDEVRAAQVEVQALRNAGLEPDPIVVRIAELEPPPESVPAGEAAAVDWSDPEL